MEIVVKSLALCEPAPANGRIKKPTAQARARTVYRGGKVWHYIPSESTKVREIMRAGWVARHGKTPCSGPVHLFTSVWFPRPQSHFLKGALRGEAPAEPIIKPDHDNLEKLVSDALKGVAFLDDAQITKAVFVKQYHPLPFALAQWEITLWEL